jgi:TRAP-type C4-dicarboxylate transport system permease small subunit
MIKLDNKDIALALVAIACGGYALLAASGVIPAQTANDTPAWVVGLAGMAFVIAGIMIFLRNYSRALDLFAAVILASFTLIAGWITFHASSEGFSGGIPFLPNDMNVSLARIMFGLGGLLCFGGFLYALKRFFRSHK